MNIQNERPSLSWLAPTQDEALHGLRDLVVPVDTDLHFHGPGVLAHPWSRILTCPSNPDSTGAAALQHALEEVELGQVGAFVVQCVDS